MIYRCNAHAHTHREERKIIYTRFEHIYYVFWKTFNSHFYRHIIIISYSFPIHLYFLQNVCHLKLYLYYTSVLILIIKHVVLDIWKLSRNAFRTHVTIFFFFFFLLHQILFFKVFFLQILRVYVYTYTCDRYKNNSTSGMQTVISSVISCIIISCKRPRTIIFLYNIIPSHFDRRAYTTLLGDWRIVIQVRVVCRYTPP